ncbi:MAG: hypothetical protein L0I29_13950 [Hyphomicrobiales bacterium]|nr:hypothetical protein [Hyphomicrobiales bacterium]
MRFGLSARHILVRLACVLSLTLVAFGHDPLVLPRTDTLAIAAHAFPDGSLPVICATDTAGKGDHTQAHRNGCDACRISSSFFLLVPDCVASVERIGMPAVLPLPSEPPVIRAAYPPSAPPQAPPLQA